jgi:hypothetical protein
LSSSFRTRYLIAGWLHASFDTALLLPDTRQSYCGQTIRQQGSASAAMSGWAPHRKETTTGQKRRFHDREEFPPVHTDRPMMPQRLTFPLPRWFRGLLADDRSGRRGLEERMALVIELARRNVREGTGGPFAAAVFEQKTGALVSAGVNLVTYANCSALHAEMVALMFAQRSLGTYDLGAETLPRHQLVASA